MPQKNPAAIHTIYRVGWILERRWSTMGERLTPKRIISITAVLSMVNGAAYLLLPVWSLSVLGASTNATGWLNTRYFGACALGYGILLWLIRGTTTSEVIRAILVSILITLGFSALAGIWGQLDRAVNSLGLLLVFTDISLALGSGLCLFKGLQPCPEGEG